MKKSILRVLVILAFMIIPTAFAGRVDLTTYYPATYGEYKTLKVNGAITFGDGSTQSSAPTPYVVNWSGALPIGNTTTASKVISGPAVILVMWKALAANSANAGATYSFLYVDSTVVDQYGGLRNPAAAVVQWFDQANSWVGTLTSGSHTISVQERVDTGSGSLNNGQLSIMVWGT